MESLIHSSLCGPSHGRRAFLRALGFAGASWLTPVGQLLAAQSEKSRKPAKSIIMICLGGGPSQLETFDPKPGKLIAGGTKAVKTAVKGVELAEGFGQLADVMGDVSLVRSLVSKEGDHERGVYQLKTGYRPEPTIEHASIGAIFCHEVSGNDPGIPRHVSILSSQWPARGGYLGGEFDAFQVDDPLGKLPDVTAAVTLERAQERLRDLDIVEGAFARGRARRVEETLHRETTRRARVMMDSTQLRAFDVSQEPAAVRAEYGDTPFGRACLAARRLTEVGVRCIEVTLNGWDSHVNNHEMHRANLKILDPALAALLRDLKRRNILEETVVLCAGEFGRTPKINPLGGRDHWPTGYSVALAGGGITGGRVIGETDAEGVKDPADPRTIADVHATILKAVGLDPRKENIAPKSGRPVKLSEGKVIAGLLG